MANSPGWAASLKGEKLDLDDLRQMLEPPFDPWVEDYKTDDSLRLLLRSAQWASARVADEDRRHCADARSRGLAARSLAFRPIVARPHLPGAPV
jgi:hypothetical protein